MSRPRARAVVLVLLGLSVVAVVGIALAGTAAADGDDRTVADYADEETGTIEADELREAIADWREGELETDLLRDVIDAWRTGDPVLERELTGTVTDQDGEPLAGATVAVAPADDPQATTGSATTGADGTYAIVVDEPGTYQLTVEYEAVSEETTVDLDDGEWHVVVDLELELEPETATIEGTVTDVDGAPIADAEVIDAVGSTLATTDADGTYAVEVAPGEPTLRVTATGYQNSGLQTVSAEAGETVTDVDFVLEEEDDSDPGGSDPGGIDGATFERGERYTIETGIQASGTFDDDAEYTIQFVVENPDGERVDVGASDDFRVEEVFIPALGETIDGVTEDNVDEGVFYLDRTVSGEYLNAASGEQPVEVTASVGETAETGEYTFDATLVEFDDDADGSQAVDALDRLISASFEIVD